MTSFEKLKKKTENGLHICVGLDSDINKIPEHLRSSKNPILEFNREIIEKTKDIAAAYKLNLAFYESEGIPGMETMQETLSLIPEDVLTIGDAKRGDIGNTSQMYAHSLFDHFGFDASTLNPYMGIDSVKPFLDYSGKLNFILALTSNKSNGDFEKLKLENGRYLFQEVIEKINLWNTNNNCGLVFGATNSEELFDNVHSFSKIPALVPGIGAQGGSLEDVVKAFASVKSNLYVINISRALIYADSSEEFGNSARTELVKFNDKIAGLKKNL